ncbi:hypothetical protein EYR38_007679 [Pleurotus pulmonarius]|nr:hypothetical protein EYR38_007679 [Pleurotus pulmonarius]
MDVSYVDVSVCVRDLSWPCGSLTDVLPPLAPRSTSIIVATAVQPPPAPPILVRSSAVGRHRILRRLPRLRDTLSSVRACGCGRSFVHSLVHSTLGWVSDGCGASEHPYQTETNGIAK